MCHILFVVIALLQILPILATSPLATTAHKVHRQKELIARVCAISDKPSDQASLNPYPRTYSCLSCGGELTILNEYASLRQHITITTVVPVTTTVSSDPGAETEAIVALAGGATWLLAGTMSYICFWATARQTHLRILCAIY